MEDTGGSHVSLIDLSRQFPFEIDAALKQQLCFAETLVISCAHCRGCDAGDYGDVDWSSDGASVVSDPTKSTQETNPPDAATPTVEEEEEVVEDPEKSAKKFDYFFFPDCNKTPPVYNSKTSIIMENDFPKLNLTVEKQREGCTCEVDENGECPCIKKFPCSCGAVTLPECTCSKLKKICICHGVGDPRPECTCANLNSVCLCHPSQIPVPICSCENIKIPCTCLPNPRAVCECKFKPNFLKVPEEKIMEDFEGGEHQHESLDETNVSIKKEISEEELNEIYEDEYDYEFAEQEEEQPPEPCRCQSTHSKESCYCIKGQDCVCSASTCSCMSKEICTCDDPNKSHKKTCKELPSNSCFCDEAERVGCECLDNLAEKLCYCGDPENCVCQKMCECIDPCICDQVKSDDICVCIEKAKQLGDEPICVCKHPVVKPEKLKKYRAIKQGYRWCKEVDPHHTFFDYAFGRHDKISHKEQVLEKIKILGLHDDDNKIEVEEVGEVKKEKVVAPPYVKKPQKNSLDCCSAVGGISISVETLGEDKSRFLVQVVSHSSKEGAKTGSKLISILDDNLHTLEENRTEHITNSTRLKERRSYIAICKSGYYNKVTRINDDKSFVKRLYHTFDAAKNFLLEGANIVLMRYFSIQRTKATIKTDTVMIGGQICESVYVCKGVSQSITNGKPLFVVQIERHIIEPNGLLHQTLTVLTLRGHMVSHEWADNNYVMHINPLLNIIPVKDEIENNAPLRERWREDLQLFSDFLDHKSMRSSEGARFMVENGDLTGTMKDYLQTLLLLKPADVLNFTRHYFGSVLSSLDLPQNEYFDSSVNKNVRYYYYEN